MDGILNSPWILAVSDDTIWQARLIYPIDNAWIRFKAYGYNQTPRL